jgi:hypothetical protein
MRPGSVRRAHDRSFILFEKIGDVPRLGDLSGAEQHSNPANNLKH